MGSEASRHYFVQKFDNYEFSAIMRVSSKREIEKLAGGELINPKNLVVRWEEEDPLFVGCRQKILTPGEAKDYISYFKRKEKERKN